MTTSFSFGRADLAAGGPAAVTAAGTAAATATALNSMVNIVTTATGESGVKLPEKHAQGSPIIAVSTASTVAMLVYPPTTAGKINSTTSAFSVAQNKPVVFYAHPNGIDYTAVLSA
jgi:mannitol-1-phosphate/altronate dehydrogenase